MFIRNAKRLNAYRQARLIEHRPRVLWICEMLAEAVEVGLRRNPRWPGRPCGQPSGRSIECAAFGYKLKLKHGIS